MNKHCCQNVQTISFDKTFKVLVWILSGVVGAPWSMSVIYNTATGYVLLVYFTNI
jgi:hypothetical protein